VPQSPQRKDIRVDSDSVGKDGKLSKAIDDAFTVVREYIADRRATERADKDRYMLIDRPGLPVFDGVMNRMMPSSRAKVWAREELMGSDYDGVHDDVLADHLETIAKTLRTGELPDFVDDDSRRGCCGATFREECDSDGTSYFCRLCGKEVEP
jgi:hypothetical protein